MVSQFSFRTYIRTKIQIRPLHFEVAVFDLRSEVLRKRQVLLPILTCISSPKASYILHRSTFEAINYQICKELQYEQILNRKELEKM